MQETRRRRLSDWQNAVVGLDMICIRVTARAFDNLSLGDAQLLLQRFPTVFDFAAMITERRGNEHDTFLLETRGGRIGLLQFTVNVDSQYEIRYRLAKSGGQESTDARASPVPRRPGSFIIGEVLWLGRSYLPELGWGNLHQQCLAETVLEAPHAAIQPKYSPCFCYFAVCVAGLTCEQGSRPTDGG